MLTGYVASSVYLLEHAIWAYTTGEPDKDTHVDVFGRWVEEGGLVAAIAHVKRVNGGTDDSKRVLGDSVMVFGDVAKAKL